MTDTDPTPNRTGTHELTDGQILDTFFRSLALRAFTDPGSLYDHESDT
ncbi:hypothetical protein GS538_09230 [Rhodococcus hoagii]|nr:hypothetical protein [Prescottella equi]